jgi:hypothetical protein
MADPQLDQDQGSLEPLDEAASDTIDTEDGGAYVAVGDAGPESHGDFFANLVETIDPTQLNTFVVDLLDKIEQDKEARKKRDEQQADALRRTGFSDEAPGGADFVGASKVVHPMIGAVSIDFAARIMKEIFPPDGPVKDKIIGDVTDKKVARAKRKVQHLNWQLTEQMPEFRPMLEQVLSQVPPGGVQYTKHWYDPQKRRPTAEVVWVDDMLLPYAAPSFLAARRRTVVLRLTEQEYQRRVAAGTYADVDMAPTSLQPDETKSAQASNRIEGKASSPYNEDGVRLMYETYVWLTWDDDDQRPKDQENVPYVLTLDESTRTCAAMYRDWDPDVAGRLGVVEELDHIVEWPFIPWRGAYPIGIFHLIGGMSIAATGALRALLDSAHLNNSGAGVKLKGGLRGGQSINAKVTQINELESSINNDDVRKLFMPFPYNPPSNVLLELLGFLTEQAAGMVRTALDDTADLGPNAPVGTTLARQQEGLIVYSSIHARMHAAMARVLRIMHRINRDTLEARELTADAGEPLALPQDYRGAIDVVPVSDPNIFSETQRVAQVQVIAQRATGNPLYDQAKVEQRILDTLKIPNPTDLLVNPPNPDPQDPVTDVVQMSLGRAAVAFPNQDHLAHLMVKVRYLSDPNFGQNMFIGPVFIPLAIQNIKEHFVFLYAKFMSDAVERAAGGAKLAQLSKTNDPRAQNALARAFAAATVYVQEEQAPLFKQVNAAIAKAIQFMQQLQQQTAPQDPAMAAAQAALQDVQRKSKDDQTRAQLEAQKVKVDAAARQQELSLDAQQARADTALRAAELHHQTESAAAEAAIRTAATKGDLQREAVAAGVERQRLVLEAREQDLERQLTAMKERARLLANSQDNATALKIALLEMAADERAQAKDHAHDKEVAVKTGHGLGRNPNPTP